MAQLFKFFNSAPGDPRTYQAADFADYFGTVLKDGIIAVDGDMGLQVTHDTGLTVNVAPGKSILRGHLYENTAVEPLEVAIPEVALDRIDRIVLRLDSSIGERNILLAIKQGESSLTPEPPELTRTSFVYEISLAQIFLERNTASVGTIADERLNEELAGAVSSLISVPTDVFEAEWQAWFDSIQAQSPVSQSTFDDHISEGKISAHKAQNIQMANGNSVEEEINSPDFNTIQLTALEQIKSVVDSYGGVAEFLASGATLFQAIVDGENKPNGTTRSFTGENGIVYFVKPTNIFVTGTGATVNVTNNTGVNANIMAIPVTGTPYELDTINQINARIGTYWEGLKSTEETEVSSKDSEDNITSKVKITCTDPLKFDLAELLNGVKNTVEYKDGKYRAVKRVSKKVVLKTTDFDALNPEPTNFDRVRVRMSNILQGLSTNQDESIIQGDCAVGGWVESTFSIGASAESRVGRFYTSGTSFDVWFMVEKGKYPTLADAQNDLQGLEVICRLVVPIVIEEKDFSEYGIDIDGLLTSNNDFTEFYVNNYNLFAPTDVSYSTNLAKAVENNKEAIQGLRTFTSNQNLINLEFDARITLLE